MSCFEPHPRIEDFIGGGLGGELPKELESHLKTCSVCINEFATWQMCFDWLLKSFPDQAPPEDLWVRICADTWGK